MLRKMSRERQILDAAATLFYERGFHQVGVDDIGERVGVTGPAIYRHFSGKDHVLATLYNEALDELFLRIGGEPGGPACRACGADRRSSRVRARAP